MLSKKNINILAVTIICIAVICCIAAVCYTSRSGLSTSDSGITKEYETELFDTSKIMSVNIIMDEDEWQEMLDNAISEEYYSCDVEVNGTMFYNVGIRPKGNTSLSMIAADDSTDRYSFKLEFDHYVDGQTCFGLDKLLLNNNYADNTNMKEAIVYDMFQYLGVDSSLYNYANISVNGETWGVYLALEGVEESFLERNYGSNYGKLYKPDSMNMDNGNMEIPDDFEMPDGGEMPDGTQPQGRGQRPDNAAGSQASTDSSSSQTSADSQSSTGASGSDGANSSNSSNSSNASDAQDFGQMTEGFEVPTDGGGFGSGSGGSNLNYTDDDLDSYSDIWDGEVIDSDDADHTRVVTALKNICSGTDIEDYLDVDNVLKYMAVHTFVVNLDSLSGNMAHNYYLYEKSGMLNLIPWDYNLAFGGFQSGAASDTINFAIDTPFSQGISTEDRQFFMSLLENEEYSAKYHEYLRQLAEEYVDGGVFDQTYERIRSQLDTLVENDPNAFQTYEEYQSAAELLNKVVKLRAESVEGQLDGSIPSTNEGQQADSSSLIDCTGIDLDIMGSMNGGGGEMDFGDMDFGGAKPDANGQASEASSTQSSEAEQNSDTAQSSEAVQGGDSGQTQAMPPDQNGQEQGGGDKGGQFSPPGMDSGQSSSTAKQNLILFGISFLIIIAGIIIARKYKR